jgi:hypothetical protein
VRPAAQRQCGADAGVVVAASVREADSTFTPDNLFHADHYKWSLRFTVINLTNKVALYNFLSTFSGTHFVTPRSYTAELGFHF